MSTTVLQKARPIIDDELTSLLVSDVSKKFPEWTDDFARRGVQQMTGFLAACASATTPLGPSKTVDEFWHAFILRTMAYADFCQQIAGRFIHHVPDDNPDETGDSKVELTNLFRQTTIDAIKTAGYEIDSEFWPMLNAAKCSTSKCTQCHQGCYDSNVK